MVKTYRIIRITPGGRHAWVESSVGPIRKPLNNIKAWDPEAERKKIIERRARERIARETAEADKMLEQAKKTFRWKWGAFWRRVWRLIRRCK